MVGAWGGLLCTLLSAVDEPLFDKIGSGAVTILVTKDLCGLGWRDGPYAGGEKSTSGHR